MITQPEQKVVYRRAAEIAAYLDESKLESIEGIGAEQLSNQLNNILEDRCGNIALFDYVDFRNTGDQALWYALLRLVEETKATDRRLSLLNRNACSSNIEKDISTVIFTGGGSLGDRYNSSRQRVSLLEAHKQLSFVQMPVSTTFGEDHRLLERLKYAYRKDRGFVFCRDFKSAEQARSRLELDPKVVPDMVELLPSCNKFRTGEFGTLYLLRTDQELLAQGGRISSDLQELSVDWPDFITCRLAGKIVSRLRRQLPLDKYLMKGIQNNKAIASIRLKQSRKTSLRDTAMALSYLSFYSRIVTDRLHGIILGRNLGMEIEYLDNDHGKLSRYIETWSDLYQEVKAFTL